MTEPDPTLFDRLYEQADDPWGFTTSAYERAKYDATIAALGNRRFARGFEAGCSIGVLTARLASICDALLAIDVAQAAIDRARRRCADLPNVSFERGVLPAYWPEGDFDLILFSEILYFLSAAQIADCARRACAALRPGGVVLLVNWLGHMDGPISGDHAADLFIDAATLSSGTALRMPLYRIDRLTHPV